MNRKLASKILQYLLGLALGGVLLVFAFKGIDLEQLKKDMAGISLWWLGAALLVGLTSHLLRAVAWRMQLRAAGYDPPLSHTFASILFMYSVNQVMPRAGELARCSILLRTDKIPLATSFGTAVASRVLDVGMLVLFLGAILLLERGALMAYLTQATAAKGTSSPDYSLFVWLGVAGLLLLTALWFWRKQLLQLHLVQRIKNFAMELIRGAVSIRKLNSPVLFVLASASIWLCYWASSYLYFYCFTDTLAISGQTNLIYFSLLVTLMSGIGMLVPTPGGIGPYHQAVIFTFKIYLAPALMAEEVAKQMGMKWALASHSSQFILLILSGTLAYFFLVSRTPRDAKILS